MASLVLSNTYSGVGLNYIENVSDIEIVWQNGSAVLYATTGAYGGATAFDIQADGFLIPIAQASYALFALASPDAGLEFITFEDRQYFIPFGAYDWSLAAFEIDASGIFTTEELFTWQAGGLGNPSALTSVVIDDQTHVFAANSQTTGFSHYVINPQFQFELVANSNPLSIINRPDVVDINVVSVGSSDILLSLSQHQVGISSYRLDASGSMSKANDLTAEDHLPISTPTAFVTGQVEGTTYAVIASAGSSSLTVVEILADGSFNPTDHVIDNKWSRFSGITELAATQVGDRLYIVGAGADDGLTLFTLLPNGMLVYLDSVADNHLTSLQNVSALEMEFVAGNLQIFASSETERGITQFEYDLGPIGVSLVGDGSSNVLHGTAANDQIDGGVWSETLFGGEGDDILRDGLGEDTLSGGAGADLFVLAADNMLDTITDFQPGLDTLNLSEFFMLYDVGQLVVTSHAWGAEIRFRDEITRVYSANGTPLDSSHFTNFDTLILDRPPNGFQFIPETISGTIGDDILQGDEGIETLFGLDGNDLFLWSLGADVFNGGSGTDTVSYAGAASSVWIDLTNRHATGAADGDIHHSIENVIGTDWDDTLVGDANSNTLTGGDGDDLLEGHASGDILDGGAGIDTVTYANSTSGVTIDLSLNLATGAAAGDQLVDIENLIGTRFNDNLVGDNGINFLFGGNGNDTLSGGDGFDLLDGGAGQDWADYRTSVAGILIKLDSADAGDTTLEDTLISIEHIKGSNHDDEIHGNAVANTILSNQGDDTVFGGDGNDTLIGSFGNDALYGQNGNDVISGGDGNDTLIGNLGNDTLLGGHGNDLLNGGGGSDTLHGSYGSDHMIDAGGKDKYHGGPGIDTVDYSLLNAGVHIDLRKGKGYGAAAGDSLVSVENIIGSKGHDTIFGHAGKNTISGHNLNDKLYGLGGHDTIFGDGGRDQLFGGTGNDRLFGGHGPDVLRGEGGNDVLFGGTGPDLLDGGAGTDIANYSDATAGVVVNINSNKNYGAATGDKFVSIECIVGSIWNDHIVGNNRFNILRGGDGNDILNALGGNDRIFGGDGNDRIIAGTGRDHFDGGAGIDTLVMTQLTSAANVWLTANTGGAGMKGDKIYAIENLLGTRFNDYFVGDSSENMFRGAAGNDSLSGGSGHDTLFGDAGHDRLYGNGDDDTLYGGHGNDHLAGHAGNDILTGGTGADIFIYHSGQDQITDFASDIDTIKLHRSLWGGDSKSALEILAYAQIQDGNTVFDFGEGNTLTVDGVDDLQLFHDDIFAF